MESLPPELVTKIFSFLDPASIIRCGQVCQRWRAIAVKLTSPLYLPKVAAELIQKLHCIGPLRDTLKMRLVCKLWKEGLDILTNHNKLLLRGLTTIESFPNVIDALTNPWNPFPTRIVRLKLCFGHDDPDNHDNRLENDQGNLIMERFGLHVRFLQVHLQHADCAEKHLRKILNYLSSTLEGLVVTECVSPHRFSKRKSSESAVMGSNSDDFELGLLENLKFLKLDDSDSKLKYSNLYKSIIENSPNLRHLEINGYQHLDIGIVELLAYRISSKMALTHLKMDTEGSEILEILEILNKSNLPLKYFSLKINGFGDNTECSDCTTLLHSSLKKFGPTLERLELKLSWFEQEGNMEPDLLFSFPSSKYLTRVERFKLVGYRGQLDFLKDFKMLSSLMIVNYNADSQKTFYSDESFHQIIPRLRELYLPLQGTLYSADHAFKKKLQNFMYEGDLSFSQKYCGLYQELFP